MAAPFSTPTRRAVVVVAAALAGAARFVGVSQAADVVGCGGGNLLPNAGFATELAPWTGEDGTGWSSEDAQGSASSGSVQIEISALTSKAVTYCVPVAGGARYQLGVDVLIGLQGNVQGKAGIVARWRADAECSNALNEFSGNAFFASAPEWRSTRLVVDVPEAAHGALLELRATKTGGGGGGTITANLDNAYFAIEDLPACGDPACAHAGPSSSDALYTLRASVGSVTCDLCYCDVNGSGGITAGDALVVLRAAVGISVDLACPACG